MRIPQAARWYNLRLDAARTPGATLSTQIHAIWHFPAHGTSGGFSFTPRLYAIQLLPAGLDTSNRAASASTTPVALRVYGIDTTSPLLLPVVRAQESTDDGKTWRMVTVLVHADHYLLSVRNPRHPGFVSLRLYVRDSSGISEKLTVIHAYGVR